ncbi:hypothetical protein AYJ54_44720 [Bradyrhizobium centrolobii]|uniref:Uncharacterized protein n=1 Tax=Bradyrhizobium centrolobii TaxID=1505087 RepID=A0A176Z1M1_9BRAD|nr:hypothetical protein [Bradyrhizobium centrolobii]OAF13090.1 hypothetical protein AYJ54_44720 [Bradyrhizobium centrolobii]
MASNSQRRLVFLSGGQVILRPILLPFRQRVRFRGRFPLLREAFLHKLLVPDDLADDPLRLPPASPETTWS